MKLKYSGLTASGNTHPKFTRGDIYRDQYGGTVMIKGVEERRVTYRREGYEYDCVMPVYQFRRDFSLVQTAPHNVPTSNARAWAHAKQWQEQDGRLAGDNVPPVVLADDQLDELADLRIIDEGRYCVRLYKAGHIRPSNINAIAHKLAAAGVTDANYYPEGMHSHMRENWREYLERVRGKEPAEEKNHQRKTNLPDTTRNWITWLRGLFRRYRYAAYTGLAGPINHSLPDRGRAMLPLVASGEAAGLHMVRFSMWLVKAV